MRIGPALGLGGIPPWVFIVAFSALVYLEAVPGVSPQLYADILKRVSSIPGALLSAARFTNF